MKNAARYCFVLLFPVFCIAQGSYKQPSKAVMDVLTAPAIPTVSVSPVRDRMALLEPLRYPPISELAQPMLKNGYGQYLMQIVKSQVF